MSKGYFCVNRDSAVTGYVEAETPNDAAMKCVQMWRESGCHDIDHVHEDRYDFDTSKCEHCKAIWAKQALETKH